jgi:Ner family transcriptional regulator
MTLAELSLKLGYGQTAVRQLNFVSLPRAQAGVARFLGLAPQQIWPSRYDAAGKPVRKRRSDAGKPKRTLCAEKPQKQEAA